MANFKRFMAVWLSIVVAGTVIAVAGFSWFPNNESLIMHSSKNHFSVQWMGFLSGYNAQYPDYYICTDNLKDAVLTMNIAFQIKNQEASGYYFLIDKYTTPPSGWTITPNYIGYISVDQTKNFTYSNIQRVKPASITQGKLTETVNLVVKAYYDSAYSNLYSQDDFAVTFNFIDKASSAWTTLYNDNFDDGTTEGWTAFWPFYPNSRPTRITVTDTYYRSFPYSLKLYESDPIVGVIGGCDIGYMKSYNVESSWQEAYLVFSIRSNNWLAPPRISFGGTQYFSPDSTPSNNVWYQFTIPLPIGQTTQVEIWTTRRNQSPTSNEAFLDEVYVIAK